jgi:hypothetical protein
MVDLTLDNPPAERRERPPPASIIVPPLVFVGAVIMAADFTAITLRPLRVLQIPYPGWMDYAQFLVPGACAVVWLASLRKWPNAGAVVAVLLCSTLVPLIPRYAESRVARVPVTRWIESNDLKSIESALGVRVSEQGSHEGTFGVLDVGKNGEMPFSHAPRR